MEDNVIMWGKTILTDRTIVANRPDLIILNKNEQNCLIEDVAVPYDINVLKIDREEVEIHRSADLEYGMSLAKIPNLPLSANVSLVPLIPLQQC